jgi:tetratricopeptide (TPR) repeat protein
LTCRDARPPRIIPAMRLVLALLLVLGAAPAARAGQDDPRLPQLFQILKTSPSEDDAARAAASIWRIWAEGRDEDISLLMRQGIGFMARRELDEALSVFDDIVKRDPAFAEGWNKRATVYFLMGRYDDSVHDVEQTLALEPRHFGALAGLGQINLALGRKAAALRAFEAALAVNPHLDSVREAVEELKQELQGKPT